MLKTEEKQFFAALVSLRGNPDFTTVMSWVEAERERTKEMLVRTPIDRFQHLQGEANALGNLLKQYRDAPDVLKRMNTQDRP